MRGGGGSKERPAEQKMPSLIKKNRRRRLRWRKEEEEMEVDLNERQQSEIERAAAGMQQRRQRSHALLFNVGHVQTIISLAALNFLGYKWDTTEISQAQVKNIPPLLKGVF